MKNNLVRRYKVIGSRRISNYVWAILLLLGSSSFLFTGILSYLNFPVSFFIHTQNIIFFPQGLVMCFYGILGLIFSFYLWLTILWNIGGGFNEFNKKTNKVQIFRWGFPGKNRRISLTYSIDEIESIKIQLQQGFNPKQTIYLKIQGKQEIPLTRIGQPLTLESIEKQAAELAKFLKVSISTIEI